MILLSFLKRRSVRKTISWRVIAVILTIITAWIVTGSMAMAASIGSVDMVLKTICYWIHEEIWDKL